MIFKKSDDKPKDEQPVDEQPVEDQPRKDFPPRKMFQGDWKCSDCGKEIPELPFEPSPDRPIYCRDCWSKRRTQRFNR